MFKAFLVVLAVLGLVLAQGCATAPVTGPAVIVPAGIQQPVKVEPGEKVIVVSPYDPTLRLQSQSDIYRHVENMANINQRAAADQLRYQAEKDRNQTYLQRDVVREVGDAMQAHQRERTYRSQNLQRTLSDLSRSYYSSQGQKVARRQSAPRPILFPRQR